MDYRRRRAFARATTQNSIHFIRPITTQARVPPLAPLSTSRAPLDRRSPSPSIALASSTRSRTRTRATSPAPDRARPRSIGNIPIAPRDPSSSHSARTRRPRARTSRARHPRDPRWITTRAIAVAVASVVVARRRRPSRARCVVPFVPSHRPSPITHRPSHRIASHRVTHHGSRGAQSDDVAVAVAGVVGRRQAVSAVHAPRPYSTLVYTIPGSTIIISIISIIHLSSYAGIGRVWTHYRRCGWRFFARTPGVWCTRA